MKIMRYEFDRYINGQLMAEGVTIEKAETLEAATASAVRIASKGPNGEAPVLVLRREREPVEPVAWLLRYSRGTVRVTHIEADARASQSNCGCEVHPLYTAHQMTGDQTVMPERQI